MLRNIFIYFFTLLLSLFCPFFIKAQEMGEIITVDNLCYMLNTHTGEAYVRWLANRDQSIHNLTIPKQISYKGVIFPVTKIYYRAFQNCTNLTGYVSIPNSVKEIGNAAFERCTGLTGTLNIPNSVKIIGASAYYGCTGFTGSLTIPNSVETIEDMAFMGCTNFSGSLTLPNSLTELGERAFEECSGFSGTLTIPNSLTTINKRAFYQCCGFTGLSIPNSVKIIGSFAFGYCEGFTGSLVIPNSVITIESGAFIRCTNFHGSLNIPNSVTKIGGSAFNGCSGFNGTLTISNSVNEIGDYTFRDCSGFTGSLTIPNSVTSIGEWAFYNCTGFTGTLTLSNSLTTIGAYAFNKCNGFTGSLIIPNTVTTIGAVAFASCNGLTGSLDLPNTVATIGPCAFQNCSGFNGGLSLSNSLQKLERSVFENCNGFTGSLNIPNSVTEICERAFYNCSGFSGPLAIPDLVSEIGEKTFYNCKGLNGSLTLPNSIKAIGSMAFISCSGLVGALIIPNSMITIEEHTFDNCGFNELYLPPSVNSIKLYAFAKTIFNKVVCEAETPPIAEKYLSYGFVFSRDVFNNADLFVPSQSLMEYKNAETWKEFYKIKGIGGDIEAEIVELDKTSVTLFVKGDIDLHATIKPEDTTDKSVVWKSTDESIATVNSEGKVLAVSIGSTTITATAASGAFATCEVSVIATPAGSITLNKTEATLKATETVELVATVLPENTTDKSVTWESSDEAIATVDANGKVTAVAVGKAIITATATSVVSAICEVTVVETPAGGIIIDKDALGIMGGDLEMCVGDVKGIKVTVTPETTTDKSASYESSNSAIASVDKDGNVTAHALGTSTITITANSNPEVKATLKVTVIATSPGSISLNQTEATLKATETVELVATILPETTTDKSVTWESSDEAVATVDADGKVTAVAVGKATITAIAASGIEATCAITVVETPAGEIIIDKDALGITGDDLEMRVGETKTVKVTVEPETATDKSITFKSSSPKVATVNADGEITAIAIGQCTITVTAASGVSANININVIPTAAEIIRLNHTYVNLETSETIALIATILPENTTYKSVAWSSSDENVATVDALGTVTGVTAGKAVITASTTNGVTAKCTVTVVSKATAIGDVTEDADVKVSVADGAIVVTAPVGETVTVYNISGMGVAESKEHRITGLTPGVYLVRVADRTFKVAL